MWAGRPVINLLGRTDSCPDALDFCDRYLLGTCTTGQNWVQLRSLDRIHENMKRGIRTYRTCRQYLKITKFTHLAVDECFCSLSFRFFQVCYMETTQCNYQCNYSAERARYSTVRVSTDQSAHHTLKCKKAEKMCNNARQNAECFYCYLFH